jgi:uncharacterized protein YkwD
MEPGLWAKFASAITNFARRVGNPYLRPTDVPGPLPTDGTNRHRPYILPMPIPGPPEPVTPPRPSPAPQAAKADGLRLMALANAERARTLTGALTWNDALARAAFAQANVCARAGVPTHDAPGYRGLSDRFAAAGYPANSWLGENADESPTDDPDAAEAAWERSPLHLANIRNPRFRHFGAAEVTGPDGRAWYVECFGGPA